MTIWHSQAVNEEDHGILRYSIILKKVETVEGVFYHLFVEESCKEASLPRETHSCKVRLKERTSNDFSIDHKSRALCRSQGYLRGEQRILSVEVCEVKCL